MLTLPRCRGKYGSISLNCSFVSSITGNIIYAATKCQGIVLTISNAELVLNMLAEVAATDISVVRQPNGFDESAAVAKEGAEAAKTARLQIEKSTGKPVVSQLNAKSLKRIE